MEQKTAAVAEQGERTRRSRLSFYHANSKGAGTAVQFELRMNRGDEQRYDCCFLDIAHQKTVAAQGEGGRVPATFDWSRKATVKLDFADICEMLTVLEGRREHMGNGQNGIYHETASASTLVSLKKNAEAGGYLLGVSRKRRDGEQLFKGHILLSEAESVGLRCALQTTAFVLAFGISLGLSQAPQ